MTAIAGGGIKFFKKSKCLFADGTTIVASTNTSSARLAIDRNPITYWRSGSSDDTVTETLTLTFAEDITIDRLLLLDHNWKEFNVKYNVSGTWTHFASVIGLDGTQSNITETAFADDTAYYEFTPVTTDSIQIQVTKTQVVNDQKYINQIIVTEILGTLAGFPIIKNTTIDRNLRKNEMLSGKILVQKSEESFKCDLDFGGYPAGTAYTADTDLIFSLHDKEENFIIWLCGGRRGTGYFKKQMKGYRLRDAITVQMIDVLKPTYTNNIYTTTLNYVAKFEEAVD